MVTPSPRELVLVLVGECERERDPNQFKKAQHSVSVRAKY